MAEKPDWKVRLYKPPIRRILYETVGISTQLTSDQMFMDYPQVTDMLIHNIILDECNSGWNWFPQGLGDFTDGYDTSIYHSASSSITISFPPDTMIASVKSVYKHSESFWIDKNPNAIYNMDWWHRDTQVGGDNFWQKRVYICNTSYAKEISIIPLANDAANTWIYKSPIDITQWVITGWNWFRAMLIFRYGGTQGDVPADVWWDDFHVWAEIPG